jgi:hypothetical protein
MRTPTSRLKSRRSLEDIHPQIDGRCLRNRTFPRSAQKAPSIEFDTVGTDNLGSRSSFNACCGFALLPHMYNAPEQELRATCNSDRTAAGLIDENHKRRRGFLAFSRAHDWKPRVRDGQGPQSCFPPTGPSFGLMASFIATGVHSSAGNARLAEALLGWPPTGQMLYAFLTFSSLSVASRNTEMALLTLRSLSANQASSPVPIRLGCPPHFRIQPEEGFST